MNNNQSLSEAVNLFSDVLISGSVFITQNTNLFEHTSREQIELLNILDKRGPCTPGKLAALQGVHKSAISNRINKLLTKGLVQWVDEATAEDKRTKLIQNTIKGENVIHDINNTILHTVETLLDDMEEMEIQSFIRIFSKVKHKLQSTGEKNEAHH